MRIIIFIFFGNALVNAGGIGKFFGRIFGREKESQTHIPKNNPNLKELNKEQRGQHFKELHGEGNQNDSKSNKKLLAEKKRMNAKDLEEMESKSINEKSIFDWLSWKSKEEKKQPAFEDYVENDLFYNSEERTYLDEISEKKILRKIVRSKSNDITHKKYSDGNIFYDAIEPVAADPKDVFHDLPQQSMYDPVEKDAELKRFRSTSAK